MTDKITIALAQFDYVVGDVAGNTQKILDLAVRARDDMRADLVVFPELSVCGYPPEDLLFHAGLRRRIEKALETIRDSVRGIAVLVGFPDYQDDEIFNACVVFRDGEVLAHYRKHILPNYSVFDEKRYFSAGREASVFTLNGVRVGINICEDVWDRAPPAASRAAGAEVLLAINGSPYELDSQAQREKVVRQRVLEIGIPAVYLNMVGGQDELVFDGGSFVLDAQCNLRAQLPMFREALVVTEWKRQDASDSNGGNGGDVWTCADAHLEPPESGMEPIYGALTLGLRDYVNKNHFAGVILGLSGGIDSALTAAVATDALGPERVHCVMMPSPYTSQDSLDDAAETARLLGVRLDEVGIEPAMGAFDGMLAPLFDDLAPDTAPGTTEENIQARSRMMVLMAISNKLGYMLLSTGNKSEVSVGYATLYGDMAGGYNVLKDVYKTTAYQLTRWRNQAMPRGGLGPAGRVIPERVLTKAPSAELKPDQTDQDSLPPYEVLDEILECLIEEEMGVEEITARGHDRETVNRVWHLLEMAEYKRRQACPGVKITRRAFGKDRRYPIVNAFKGPA